MGRQSTKVKHKLQFSIHATDPDGEGSDSETIGITVIGPTSPGLRMKRFETSGPDWN